MKTMINSNIEQTYNAWYTYQGMWAHFNHVLRNYDWFKYHGKLNYSGIDAMEKSFLKHENNGNFSMQRKVFTDIGKRFTNKEALIFFYLSQFTNNIKYPSHFETEKYDMYVNRMNNIYVHLEQDACRIKEYYKKFEISFNEVFLVDGVNHPAIMKLSLSKTIGLETMVILNKMLNFVPDIDKSLENDPIWSSHSFLVKQYTPFLEMDMEKSKNIVMNIFAEG